MSLTEPICAGVVEDVHRFAAPILPFVVVALAAATSASNTPDRPPPAPPLLAGSADQVLAAVRAPGASAVLVSVWATWCLPCRAEFPDLLRLRRAYAERGVRVLLVSGDFASERPQVETFLREQGVDFPTYLKSGDDTEFIDAFDPDWSGALPATFLYDGHGRRRHSQLGAAGYATLEAQLKDVLEHPAR